MDIVVDMLTGQQLSAKFGDFEIISDQSQHIGGDEQYPEPFDYFLASMPLCAAFYVRQFCKTREIDARDIVIRQSTASDSEDKYKKTFQIEIDLPESFPKKYKKALIAAANTCTVKKVIQAQPEFKISLANTD
ncbi:OsmC family protein [Thalassotalea atypica]|uniref:OsmC family protein n=1 Tax=Thalassotalea atypica TaxID=2054316 RepID=UPI00257399FF|nr:OsmC family protein [Thalassotalea atypica]